MGLWDKLKGELIDIIEWTEPSQNEILAYRFPRYNNEIKNGAKLIVREGQVAAFIKEGQLADVKAPGMYTLDTNNMPILSTLLGWKYGFESPFKCEVYFIATRQWTDQKWGTQNPVMIRDPEFGPVRLRAFGSYAFKVTDPGTFIKELVATDPSFEAFEITAQFRNVIVSRFIDTIGVANIPMLDLVGNYERISKLATERITPELQKMGVSITQFFVENISLPKEVEEALDKRAQMSVLGNLDQYTKFQSAEAIRDAASNPGGMAGAGMGLGAGIALGQQMGSAMQVGQTANPQTYDPSKATVPLHTSAEAAASQPMQEAPPPPLPKEVKIYAAIDGQQAGPFSLQHLAALISSGKVTRKSLIWKAGMSDWTEAEAVADVNELFSQFPPPLKG